MAERKIKLVKSTTKKAKIKKKKQKKKVSDLTSAEQAEAARFEKLTKDRAALQAKIQYLAKKLKKKAA